MAADRKEPRAAGVAAIGGKPKNPPQSSERAVFDAVARDSLEVEIAAARAVRVAQEHERDAAGVKTLIASTATPRKNPGGAKNEVRETAPMRAEAVRTPALRTDHCAVRLALPIGCRILEM